MKNLAFAITVYVASFASAHAVIYDELEPNNGFSTATNTGPLMPGDQIRGSVRGQGPDPDIDFWNLNVANEAPGQIYEYSLRYNTEINGIPGRQNHYVASWDTRPPFEPHGLDIIGETDASNPTKFRFYSFGINGRIQYAIYDTITTGSRTEYDMFWDRNIVTPMDLGTYNPGQFRFNGTRRPTSSDTTLVILNSAGRKVPGGAFFASGEQTFSLNLTLAPGTYYTMLSNNIAGDEVYVLPWVLRDSQFKVGTTDAHNNPLGPYAISLTAGGITRAIEYEADLASKGASGISFGKITVVPEPTTMLAFALGAGTLFARRPKKR